ncbi:hypothetical protein ZIOFF_021209 [Zingiber officinale]|uniref:SNRNP25 ubiquitin-like domain-containing protein n=1 Tax=Zingiber officinale TaxID=94328 RepID=A0A8J5HIJ9_ZINOF|nr:hypothetical protein ZIOFF_021209 [Zingiber officinale]
MPRDISGYVKLLRSLSQPVFSSGRSPSSDAGVGSRRRSSSSYFRLPSDGILRLSVLKLDGSSFDVRVARTASVRDLKDAVEDLFSELREPEDGKGSISWSHVWGHFCLCYKEHKLTDDKACLKTFRINDGDQVITETCSRFPSSVNSVFLVVRNKYYECLFIVTASLMLFGKSSFSWRSTSTSSSISSLLDLYPVDTEHSFLILHFMRHLSLNQVSNKRKSSNARAELDQQRISPTGSKVQGEVCEGVDSSPSVDKSNQSFGRIGSVELKLHRLCLLRGRFRYSRLRTTQVTDI